MSIPLPNQQLECPGEGSRRKEDIEAEVATHTAK